VNEGQEISFAFDHGRLLRWLLKVSYNSARTTGWDAALLANYRDVIIADSDCTPLYAVAFVGTVMPVHTLDAGTLKFRAIQPEGARCGRLVIPGYEADSRFITRVISINDFFFSILITHDEDIDSNDIVSFVSRIPAPTMNTLDAMRGVEAWADR
jgi:hypothetical protein